MKRFQIAVAVLMLAPLGFLGGCSRQIVYPGTGAYDKRVATFAVAPARAAELAAATQVERDPRVKWHSSGKFRWGNPVGSTPTAIIGRTYLFESDEPQKLKGLSLTGYYVSGDDATVTYRKGDFLEAGFWTGRMPTEVPDDAWDRH